MSSNGLTRFCCKIFTVCLTIYIKGLNPLTTVLSSNKNQSIEIIEKLSNLSKGFDISLFEITCHFALNNGPFILIFPTSCILEVCIEGTVMQIEKALTNDRLRVSEVSWKFRISTIYNFAIIYP